MRSSIKKETCALNWFCCYLTRAQPLSSGCWRRAPSPPHPSTPRPSVLGEVHLRQRLNSVSKLPGTPRAIHEADRVQPVLVPGTAVAVGQRRRRLQRRRGGRRRGPAHPAPRVRLVQVLRRQAAVRARGPSLTPPSASAARFSSNPLYAGVGGGAAAPPRSLQMTRAAPSGRSSSAPPGGAAAAAVVCVVKAEGAGAHPPHWILAPRRGCCRRGQARCPVVGERHRHPRVSRSAQLRCTRRGPAGAAVRHGAGTCTRSGSGSAAAPQQQLGRTALGELLTARVSTEPSRAGPAE